MKKIKVLHIFKNMNRGGAETLIMNIFRNIDKEKIQFDFLCTSNEEGSYFEEIKSLGGNIYHIPQPSKKHVIKNIRDIIKVIKQNGGYDVIHIPLMFYSGIVCLAAWMAGVPKRIVHSHNASESEKNTISRKLYKSFSKFLITLFSTNKIACGEKARDFLFGKSNKIKQETIILKNGIDINKFQNVTKDEIINLKENLGINDKQLIIGEVARFSKQKNHDFFIKLARYLKQNNINAKIVLVGDGELRKKFESKISNENLQNYFILTGVREDIPIFMNMFDIFVMPSLYEGFPVSVVESLSSGTPCLLSDNISGEVALIPEIVEFMNIDENINLIFNKILDLYKIKLNINKDYIYNILDTKGYNIKTSTKIIQKLYLN